MNRAALVEAVLVLVGEDISDPSHFTEQDAIDSLDEAYMEMSDASEWYERNYPLKLLSHRTYYDLRTCLEDPNVLTFRHAQHNTTRRWLTATSVRDLDYRVFPQWEDTIGPPERFFLRGLFWLGTFPKAAADGTTLQTWFTALPPSLEHDGSEPGFPEQFQYGLVEYAAGDLCLQDAEPTKALLHFKEYLTYETALMNDVASRIAIDRIQYLHG